MAVYSTELLRLFIAIGVVSFATTLPTAQQRPQLQNIVVPVGDAVVLQLPSPFCPDFDFNWVVSPSARQIFDSNFPEKKDSNTYVSIVNRTVGFYRANNTDAGVHEFGCGGDSAAILPRFCLHVVETFECKVTEFGHTVKVSCFLKSSGSMPADVCIRLINATNFGNVRCANINTNGTVDFDVGQIVSNSNMTFECWVHFRPPSDVKDVATNDVNFQTIRLPYYPYSDRPRAVLVHTSQNDTPGVIAKNNEVNNVKIYVLISFLVLGLSLIIVGIISVFCCRRCNTISIFSRTGVQYLCNRYCHIVREIIISVRNHFRNTQTRNPNHQRRGDEALNPEEGDGLTGELESTNQSTYSDVQFVNKTVDGVNAYWKQNDNRVESESMECTDVPPVPHVCSTTEGMDLHGRYSKDETMQLLNCLKQQTRLKDIRGRKMRCGSSYNHGHFTDKDVEVAEDDDEEDKDVKYETAPESGVKCEMATIASRKSDECLVLYNANAPENHDVGDELNGTFETMKTSSISNVQLLGKTGYDAENPDEGNGFNRKFESTESSSLSGVLLWSKTDYDAENPEGDGLTGELETIMPRDHSGMEFISKIDYEADNYDEGDGLTCKFETTMPIFSDEQFLSKTDCDGVNPGESDKLQFLGKADYDPGDGDSLAYEVETTKSSSRFSDVPFLDKTDCGAESPDEGDGLTCELETKMSIYLSEEQFVCDTEDVGNAYRKQSDNRAERESMECTVVHNVPHICSTTEVMDLHDSHSKNETKQLVEGLNLQTILNHERGRKVRRDSRCNRGNYRDMQDLERVKQKDEEDEEAENETVNDNGVKYNVMCTIAMKDSDQCLTYNENTPLDHDDEENRVEGDAVNGEFKPNTAESFSDVQLLGKTENDENVCRKQNDSRVESEFMECTVVRHVPHNCSTKEVMGPYSSHSKDEAKQLVDGLNLQTTLNDPMGRKIRFGSRCNGGNFRNIMQYEEEVRLEREAAIEDCSIKYNLPQRKDEMSPEVKKSFDLDDFRALLDILDVKDFNRFVCYFDRKFEETRGCYHDRDKFIMKGTDVEEFKIEDEKLMDECTHEMLRDLKNPVYTLMQDMNVGGNAQEISSGDRFIPASSFKTSSTELGIDLSEVEVAALSNMIAETARLHREHVSCGEVVRLTTNEDLTNKSNSVMATSDLAAAEVPGIRAAEVLAVVVKSTVNEETRSSMNSNQLVSQTLETNLFCDSIHWSIPALTENRTPLVEKRSPECSQLPRHHCGYPDPVQKYTNNAKQSSTRKSSSKLGPTTAKGFNGVAQKCPLELDEMQGARTENCRDEDIANYCADIGTYIIDFDRHASKRRYEDVEFAPDVGHRSPAIWVSDESVTSGNEIDLSAKLNHHASRHSYKAKTHRWHQVNAGRNKLHKKCRT